MPLDSSKRYVVINKEGGSALDLDVNSQQVQGWTLHGGPNQQWTFRVEEGGIWQIKNVQLSQDFLTFQPPAQDGQRIVCNNGGGIWNIQEVEPDTYVITSPGTQECVDLADGSSDDGTPVQLWTATGNDNQRWMAQEA